MRKIFALIFFVVLGFILYSGITSVEYDVVRAKRLELVDDSGVVRSVLYGDGTGGTIEGELTIMQVDDPPKIRLASNMNPGQSSGGGAISFNRIRPDGAQEEIFLITAHVAEGYEAESNAGQLNLFCRKAYSDGDTGMVRMGVISVSYTSDGCPVVRFEPLYDDLGAWSQPCSGGSPPSQGNEERLVTDNFIEMQNLNGSLYDIQDDPDSPDSNWLIAINSNYDTIIHVGFENPSIQPLEGQQEFRIFLRRTTSSGTQPYVYMKLYENGAYKQTLINEYRPVSTSGEIVSATWDSASISDQTGAEVQLRIIASAQEGTVEYGAIEWNKR